MEIQLEQLAITDRGLEFADLEEAQAVDNYEHCLIRTLITDKQFKINVLKSRMASIWRPGRKMKVTEIEGGLILFRFFHPYDLKWVVDNSPWSFDNCLLPVQPITQGQNPTDVPLHMVNFWIHIYNLPAAFLLNVWVKQSVI